MFRYIEDDERERDPDEEASFKYGSPESILVLTKAGLKEIHCPFRVKYKDGLNPKAMNQEFLITQVAVHYAFDTMIFKIGNDWEGYFMFDILEQ